MKNSGCKDKEFIKCIEHCCDTCELCSKYRKRPLRPVVSFPMADRFNQVVAMDLKEVEHTKTWILHLIDVATRYTAACLSKTKKKELVVRKIFQIWVAYFGSPIKFHSDNGGEFANSCFQEMCEKLGVEVSTTPSEAPFSNGVVERHNAILYETFKKTMDEANCDEDAALAWAVSSKNALQNNNGYSPNQLVLRHKRQLTICLDGYATSF